MKINYRIENNYILDDDQIVQAIWLKKEGLLYIKKKRNKIDTPFLKFIYQEGKRWIKLVGTDKISELENAIISKIEIQYFEENHLLSAYYKIVDSHQRWRGRSYINFKKYQLLRFYRADIEEVLFSELMDFIPGLHKAKKAYELEIKRLNSRTCIWTKTHFDVFKSCSESKLYIYRDVSNYICLDLVHIRFYCFKDDRLEYNLDRCNALWEDHFFSKILKNKQALINTISLYLMANEYRNYYDDDELEALLETDCKSLIINLNHFDPELDIRTEELIFPFKKQWLDPLDIGVEIN
ncbi:MAG: hypothetical protein ABI851_06175 [Saprospiraceae bacterium]